MSRRKSDSRHNKLVKEIAQRLERKGYSVQTLVNYQRNGYEGEFDVYARMNGVHEYHEIKSRNSKKNIRRALKQFQRARKAYPNRNWAFYLDTPDGEDRYYVRRNRNVA